MTERLCIRCKAVITHCFGSVLARDLIAAEQERIPFNQVREHCGKCTTALILSGKADQYLSSIEERRAS